jgi:hypothetical protein
MSIPWQLLETVKEPKSILGLTQMAEHLSEVHNSYIFSNGFVLKMVGGILQKAKSEIPTRLIKPSV